MPLFDMDAILGTLLPPERIVWFSDVGNVSLPEPVAARLRACAARWDGYEHPEYGDLYEEYRRDRNRCNFEDLYINRRWALADFFFCEYFLGGGAYLPQIEALIGRICGEDTWCVPAHLRRPTPDTKQVLELYGAETASVLALTVHFLGERLPSAVRARAVRAVRERMFAPFTATDAYSWMGADGRRVNNWNPWIHSNVIFCAALLCGADEYRALTARALRLTENYIRGLPPDGACDEGVRYWNLSGACVFDIAEMVYDLTGGAVDLTKAATVRGVCDYLTHMSDADGRPANFCDATFDFLPDAPLLVRAGTRTGNALLRDLGRTLYRPERLRTLHDNFYRQMKDVLTAASITPSEAAPAFPPMQFKEGIQVCTLRQNGFFLCFKGHHNGESHNHNDAGSFVLYHSGTPLFIDPGVELYSGWTFGAERYRLWTMRSDYHNLPVIAGQLQHEGEKFSAAPMRLGAMSAETELCGAYGLHGTYTRAVSMENGVPTVTDSFSYAPDEIVLHYMTREKPRVTGDGLLFGDGCAARWRGADRITVEEIDLTGQNPPDGIAGDAPYRRTPVRSVLIPRRMTAQWGQDTLYRITVRPTAQTVRLTVKKEEKRRESF